MKLLVVFGLLALVAFASTEPIEEEEEDDLDEFDERSMGPITSVDQVFKEDAENEENNELNEAERGIDGGNEQTVVKKWGRRREVIDKDVHSKPCRHEGRLCYYRKKKFWFVTIKTDKRYCRTITAYVTKAKRGLGKALYYCRRAIKKCVCK